MTLSLCLCGCVNPSCVVRWWALSICVNLQAAALLSNGHRDVLGQTAPHFWAMLQKHFGRPIPPHDDTIAIQIYGDEIQAWETTQLMAFHWMPECSPFESDPSRSRFLIAVLPTSAYAYQDKINITLQQLLREVVDSCNQWSREGVAGVFAQVTTVKGDWKWLGQALSLERLPTRNQFCFLCEGSKDLVKPWTDLGGGALWRHDVPQEPWLVRPALADLLNFDMGCVGLDLLHLWSLGIARDVIASCVTILLRTRFFQGSTVSWIGFNNILLVVDVAIYLFTVVGGCVFLPA